MFSSDLSSTSNLLTPSVETEFSLESKFSSSFLLPLTLSEVLLALFELFQSLLASVSLHSSPYNPPYRRLTDGLSKAQLQSLFSLSQIIKSSPINPTSSF